MLQVNTQSACLYRSTHRHNVSKDKYTISQLNAQYVIKVNMKLLQVNLYAEDKHR